MESELLFILALALIILGPRRLPQISRQLGRAMAEFRRAKGEFTAQIQDEVRRLELEEEHNKLMEGLASVEDNRILPPTAAPSGTVISTPAGADNGHAGMETAPESGKQDENA